jgi:hypothetical protein
MKKTSNETPEFEDGFWDGQFAYMESWSEQFNYDVKKTHLDFLVQKVGSKNTAKMTWLINEIQSRFSPKIFRVRTDGHTQKDVMETFFAVMAEGGLLNQWIAQINHLKANDQKTYKNLAAYQESRRGGPAYEWVDIWLEAARNTNLSLGRLEDATALRDVLTTLDQVAGRASKTIKFNAAGQDRAKQRIKQLRSFFIDIERVARANESGAVEEMEAWWSLMGMSSKDAMKTLPNLDSQWMPWLTMGGMDEGAKEFALPLSNFMLKRFLETFMEAYEVRKAEKGHRVKSDTTMAIRHWLNVPLESVAELFMHAWVGENMDVWMETFKGASEEAQQTILKNLDLKKEVIEYNCKGLQGGAAADVVLRKMLKEKVTQEIPTATRHEGRKNGVAL